MIDKQELKDKLEKGETLNEKELLELKYKKEESTEETKEPPKKVEPAKKQERTVEELKQALELGEKLTDEELNKIKFQNKEEKKRKVASLIIRGVNDVWEKTYDLKEIDLKFTIAIHAPSIIEQGKIAAQTERYLEGLGTTMPSTSYLVFHTLATIRICGDKVPDFLSDDENIYASNVIYLIGTDFGEWLNSFRF